jgi:hypothetical protein
MTSTPASASSFGTLFGTLADTDRRTDAQTAMRILGSQGMLG